MVSRDSSGNIIFSNIDYVDTWEATEGIGIYERGLAKSIGIPNLNNLQIARLLIYARIVPVT